MDMRLVLVGAWSPVQLPVSPCWLGGVGGGKAWWVLVGVGDEARCWVLKDHTVGVPVLVGGVVWFLWWSAPGPQTVVVSPLLACGGGVVVGVGGGCGAARMLRTA